MDKKVVDDMEIGILQGIGGILLKNYLDHSEV